LGAIRFIVYDRFPEAARDFFFLPVNKVNSLFHFSRNKKRYKSGQVILLTINKNLEAVSFGHYRVDDIICLPKTPACF
jgi:hypothetical protein